MYCRKGWSTRLWARLKGALPGILVRRLIPGEKSWKVFWGLWGAWAGWEAQGGKPKEGLCKVYPMDNLVTPPPPRDVTWPPFQNLAFVKRRTTPRSPFNGRSHTQTGGMILPSPPPTHGLPLSTPFLTSPPSAFTPPHPPPPPLHHYNPPLRTSPLPNPPLYATPRPPLDENRVAPPLAHSFVDGVGYTVVKGLLLGWGGPTWAKVAKNFEGGNEKVVRSSDHIFNVESAEA